MIKKDGVKPARNVVTEVTDPGLNHLVQKSDIGEMWLDSGWDLNKTAVVIQYSKRRCGRFVARRRLGVHESGKMSAGRESCGYQRADRGLWRRMSRGI